MSKVFFLVGLIFLFIGILLIFFSGIISVKSEKFKISGGGGIFIGPIPIFGFFSDKRMFYFLLAFAFLIFLFFLLLRLFK